MDHLDRYIQQARRHGQTDNEIHADLIDAGWDKAQIKQGLAKPETSPSSQASEDYGTGHGEHPQSPRWEGALHALDQAVKAIKRNANPALFYIAVLAIVDIASNLLINQSLTTSPAHALQRMIISGGVTLIFLPFSVCYPLALAKGIKVTIDELLHSSFKQYAYLVGCFFLELVVLILGGLALLIPLIWVIPWVTFLYFIVVDLDCGPIAALQEARRVTAGNKAKVWGIIGISIVPLVLADLLVHVPIVGDIVIPAVYLIYSTATAFLYEWLRHNAAA
jgi:hypothetical protein